MEFKIAIEQDEDGWYIVTVPSLPAASPGAKPRKRRKIVPKLSNFT